MSHGESGNESPSLVHVASVHELVDNIQSHMTREDNAVVAGVCRLWRDVARDHIWEEVHNPHEILSLVVPIVLAGSFPVRQGAQLKTSLLTATLLQAFERVPSAGDWIRVDPLLSRVRSLYVPGTYPISKDITDAILRSRGAPRPLFKNLRSIEWQMMGGRASLFRQAVHVLCMHDGLQSCRLLDVPYKGAYATLYTFEHLFQDITYISPNLTHLSLSPRAPIEDSAWVRFESAICGLLSVLNRLQSFLLSETFISRRVVEVLSHLPDLSSVLAIEPAQDSWGRRRYLGMGSTSAYTYPNLTEFSFASLRSVHILLSLREAVVLLSCQDFPSVQLRELRLHTTANETKASVRTFFDAFVASCRNVMRILVALDAPALEGAGGSSRVTALDAYSLSPLCNASWLEELRIRDVCKPSLSSDEFSWLVRCMPKLTAVEFVPDPDWMSGPPIKPFPSAFSLHTVDELIKALPLLTCLGLYLDVSQVGGSPSTMSGRLSLFNIGTTPYPSDEGAAQFFRQIGPCLEPGGRIISGVDRWNTWGMKKIKYAAKGLTDRLHPWSRFNATATISEVSV